MLKNTTSSTSHASGRSQINRTTGGKRSQLAFTVAAWLAIGLVPAGQAVAAGLWAGAAKIDITNTDAGPVNDSLYVKSLVIKNDTTTVAIVTVDAVAIGEIGHISNDYLGKVRSRIERELSIPPAHVLVNASHCHGVPCKDIAERTLQAVKEAWQNMVPVHIGAGTGHEDRIMENRRLKLKSGKEIDVRHAYSLPPDEDVAGVGPVDPEIGVLRLDRNDGRTLAVVYNFACHPIQGVPSGWNSADIAGYTNGYIYYTPTADQLRNVGRAQEDSDCLLAPEWQKLFEDKAAELLSEL